MVSTNSTIAREKYQPPREIEQLPVQKTRPFVFKAARYYNGMVSSHRGFCLLCDVAKLHRLC